MRVCTNACLPPLSLLSKAFPVFACFDSKRETTIRNGIAYRRTDKIHANHSTFAGFHCTMQINKRNSEIRMEESSERQKKKKKKSCKREVPLMFLDANTCPMSLGNTKSKANSYLLWLYLCIRIFWRNCIGQNVIRCRWWWMVYRLLLSATKYVALLSDKIL